MPDESVPAHLDVVGLGKGKNVVSRSEIEVAFSRLSRVPLQVVAGSDTVVVPSSELAVRPDQVGL